MKYSYFSAVIRFSILHPDHQPPARYGPIEGFSGAVLSEASARPFETTVTLTADLYGTGEVAHVCAYLDAICIGTAVLQGIAAIHDDERGPIVFSYDQEDERWLVHPQAELLSDKSWLARAA